MNLYLVRHGRATTVKADPTRPLTARGRAEMARVADFLKRLGLRVDAIWHSDLARAAESARIIAPAVRSREGLVERKDLREQSPIRPIRKEIARLDGDLMIVGHLPFLGELAARLVAGRKSLDMLMFPRGAVVCLVRDADLAWRVCWAIDPGLIPS